MPTGPIFQKDFGKLATFVELHYPFSSIHRIISGPADDMPYPCLIEYPKHSLMIARILDVKMVQACHDPQMIDIGTHAGRQFSFIITCKGFHNHPCLSVRDEKCAEHWVAL
ncbi:hypothetical protein Tco_1394285 [Tanacetum coccineum]